MSSIDPAKLKVVELRAELSSRGLDAKGNKPVLVKRLKEALEKELELEIPDTSIVDTSTEDALNSSQEEAEAEEDVKNVPPDEELELPTAVKSEQQPEPVEIEQQLESSPSPEAVKVTKTESQSEIETLEEAQNDLSEQNDEEESKEPKPEVQECKIEDNATSMEVDFTSDSISTEGNDKVEQSQLDQPAGNDQVKGEKRKHSSPSPQRSQRRRSRTPVVEDEPVLDENKVQLSWYDSDLHLQVDKKSFLSGKPFHEGAFGYAWAGVRATHGVKSGKACFEVKITEELKWDDLVKHSDRRRDNRRDRRDRQRHDRSSSRSDKGNSKSSRFSDNSKVDEDKSEKNAEADDKLNENSDKPCDEVLDKAETTDNGETAEKADLDEDSKDEKAENDDNPTEEAEIKEAAEVKEAADENKEISEENKEAATDGKEPVEKMETEEDKAPETQDSKGEKASEAEETAAIEPIPKHLFRVGWSIISSGLQLGEAEHSYGFESSGKFVTNKEFVDYGVKFGVGDVIGAYLDINDESVVLTFTHNGDILPVATTLSKSDLPEDVVLFPHILTRNYAFELNLGAKEEPWFANPLEYEEYAPLEKLEDKVAGPSRPEARSDCEVVMMCGLPASGKTYWVKQFVSENSDKRYNVIGNSHLLERMTVNGNPLKNSYKGRWNVILDRLMKCVNQLVEIAGARRRNFIIDQTNVFPSAQRRKMRLFEGYKRRAVVLVVADEEQTKRRALQEAQDGKDVPDSAILEMKANMNLPRRGDWLEEVTYVELNEEDAKALIQKYNQQGRDAGFGPMNNQRGGYRDNRGHPYRWDHTTSRRDYRGGYRDNRSYQNRSYDRSRQQQGGWQNRRPPPGSWNRDIRRDSRGPSNSSREFRNNNRSGNGQRDDRSSSRDNRNRNSGSSGSFNRNPRSQSSRNPPANWQGSGGSGGGTWQNQGNWGNSQGVWNQGSWGGQGSWSGQAQGQWKGGYGQQQGSSGYGQGYGNYANWNYYGQYAPNWNSQGHPQTAVDGAAGTTDKANPVSNQYSQSTTWAQYAQPQQYTQGDSASLQQHQQPQLE